MAGLVCGSVLVQGESASAAAVPVSDACVAMLLWRTLRMAVDTRDSIRAGHAAGLTEKDPFGIL